MMREKKYLNGFLLFLLTLMVAVPAMGTRDVQAATRSHTLGAFIEWMLQKDDLTDGQKADLENAQEMLEGYIDAGYIDPDDDSDATYFTSFCQSLNILMYIEELRKSDEYYNQLYDMTKLYTNFTMLVGSAYTANVSATAYAHVSSYGTFANNEGLAWGISDPTLGWYTMEKLYIDQAMEDLGYSVSKLTESKWEKVLDLAESYGTIGHYTGLFYGVSSGKATLMGVGFTTVNYAASYNAALRARYSDYAVYTRDEIVELLVEYEEHVIDEDDVTLSFTSCTYNGKARKPSVTVKVDGTKLKEGRDYTVTYKNNTDAGTAKVVIKGIGDYAGTITKKFTIKQKSLEADSAAAKVSLSKTSYVYNGSSRKPSVTVKVTLKSGKTTLVKGTDYKVSYSNNKKIGTATVTIKGTGNFKGTIKKTFKITPSQVKVSSAKSSSKKTLTVKWSKVSGSVTKYQVRYRKKGTSEWTKVTCDSSTLSKKLTGLKSGKTYEVQVRAYKTVSGKNYIGKWSTKQTVKVK